MKDIVIEFSDDGDECTVTYAGEEGCIVKGKQEIKNMIDKIIGDVK